MRTSSANYIPTLDGWRAVAILGVIICHGEEYFFSATGLYPNARIYAYLFHGARGVSIFFCLSGFLICTLLLNEHSATGTINIRAFYVRRAFRILPPYLSYLSVVAILSYCGVLAVPRREIVACLLFVRNYVQLGNWYTIHFWTLALEEHFYLLLPGILWLARGRKSLRLLLFLTVMTTAIRYYIEHTVHSVGSIKWDGDSLINELLTGSIGAILVTFKEVHSWFERTPLWLWCTLAILAFYTEVRPYSLLHVLQPVFFTFLIISTALNPRMISGKILELPALRRIGSVSYGLYIWQELFIGRGPISNLPLGILQRWPISWLMIVLVSIASFVLLEKPMIQYGKRLSDHMSSKHSPQGCLIRPAESS